MMTKCYVIVMRKVLQIFTHTPVVMMFAVITNNVWKPIVTVATQVVQLLASYSLL